MIKCFYEDGNEAKLRHVVADVLVIKDGKLLMVKRNAKLLEGGKWGVVGGFAERDETLAQTAVREVYEETGWEIDDLKLLKVNDNPNRVNEDRQNVSFVYSARPVKQTGKPDWESDEIKWFDLDDLPPREQIAFDHADMIDFYKQNII